MIKVLKLSNKSVTRFNTNKKWNYSTLNAGSNIILEQGDNIPLFSSSVNKLSTEQNDSEFDLNMRFGKKSKELFSQRIVNILMNLMNLLTMTDHIKELYTIASNIYSIMNTEQLGMKN